jgi:hypothetical protein
MVHVVMTIVVIGWLGSSCPFEEMISLAPVRIIHELVNDIIVSAVNILDLVIGNQKICPL